MTESLFAPENVLFLVSLGLFIFIFLIQLLGVVMGLEPFGFLDNLLPDFDLDLDVDADLSLPDASPGFVESVMSMLKLGRVPFVFTFVFFLLTFSLVGLYGQMALDHFGPGRLQWALAGLAAFFLSFYPLC